MIYTLRYEGMGFWAFDGEAPEPNNTPLLVKVVGHPEQVVIPEIPKLYGTTKTEPGKPVMFYVVPNTYAALEKKLEFLKELREYTGRGLKECKDLIDCELSDETKDCVKFIAGENFAEILKQRGFQFSILRA